MIGTLTYNNTGVGIFRVFDARESAPGARALARIDMKLFKNLARRVNWVGAVVGAQNPLL